MVITMTGTRLVSTLKFFYSLESWTTLLLKLPRQSGISINSPGSWMIVIPTSGASPAGCTGRSFPFPGSKLWDPYLRSYPSWLTDFPFSLKLNYADPYLWNHPGWLVDLPLLLEAELCWSLPLEPPRLAGRSSPSSGSWTMLIPTSGATQAGW